MTCVMMDASHFMTSVMTIQGPRAPRHRVAEVAVLRPAAMSDTEAVLTHPRREAHEGPLRVLVGKERFSENHAWSEMPQHWPSGLAARAVIEVVGQGQLEARLVGGGPPVDVVVPLWSPLSRRAIRGREFRPRPTVRGRGRQRRP
jgi:hypothetical protein